MLANKIITSLEELLSLHEDLYEKSKIKTDVIKSGKADALRSMTNDERKFVKTINEKQKELMVHTEAFLKQNTIIKEAPTLRDCLNYMYEQEKESATALQLKLVDQVTLIKQQNDLNQQLLEQSLAFVQMSLDLLTPDMDSYNYERPNRQQLHEQLSRSLFDSNA